MLSVWTLVIKKQGVAHAEASFLGGTVARTKTDIQWEKGREKQNRLVDVQWGKRGKKVTTIVYIACTHIQGCRA